MKIASFKILNQIPLTHIIEYLNKKNNASKERSGARCAVRGVNYCRQPKGERRCAEINRKIKI